MSCSFLPAPLFAAESGSKSDIRTAQSTKSVKLAADAPVAEVPIAFAPKSALGELHVDGGTVVFNTSTGTYAINGSIQPGVARGVSLGVPVEGLEDGEAPGVMVFDFLSIHLGPGVVVSVEGDGALILTSGDSAYLGATVDLKGGSGEAGAVDAGGGGGGGGGFHIFAGGDLQFAGSIDVGGGDGGTGAQVAGIPFGGGGGLARGGGSRGGKGSYAFAGGNGGNGGDGNPVLNRLGRKVGNLRGGGGGGGGGYSGLGGNGAAAGGAAGGNGAAGKCPAAAAGGVGGQGGRLGVVFGGKGGNGGAAPNGGVGGNGGNGSPNGGGGGGGGGGGDRCVRLPFFGPVPIPAKGGQGGRGGGGGSTGEPGTPQPKKAAAPQVRMALSSDEPPAMVGGGGGGGSVVLGSQTGLLTLSGTIRTEGGAGAEEAGSSGALTLIAAEGRLLIEPNASFNGSEPLAGGAEVTAQFPYSEYLPTGGGGGGGAGGPGQVIFYEEEPCPPGTATDGLIPICIIEGPVEF
ncbi:hypothetical protein [Gloeobacter violaceus]|uniref:hypothetical protein n=1 Tax=Gloeobacter violaceus TaxID=33072 RepID=UPI00031CAF98|nr:hypothetical protein [Gloeobacter violaceus]